MKKIQACTNIHSKKLISSRMVKSTKKTAHFSFKWAKPTLLHSFYIVLPIFFLFHYVTNSTVLCCKSVTLNNNNNNKKWEGE